MRQAHLLISAVTIAAAFAVAGCGSSGSGSPSPPPATTSAPPEASGSGEHFTNADWSTVESDPDAHKGASVVLTGKVFQIQRDQKGTYVQMWADAKNSDENTIIGISDPSFTVNEQDLIKVRGTVKGKFSGQNGFGADVSAAIVLADTVTKVSPLALRSAPITSAKAGAWTYSGITIHPWRVEWAADETRVFLKVTNNSSAPLSVYGSSAHMIADGQQFDATYSTNDYPDISSDLQPSASTSGVIVFPAMDANAAEVKLTVEASSENSDIGDYGQLKPTWTWTR
jgi:uncharacterized protein YdeI (BOF family)